MFESVGINELFLILLVLLIAIGPSKIPDMAKNVGKYMRYLTKATKDLREAIDIDSINKELNPRQIQQEMREVIGKDIDLASLKRDLKVDLSSSKDAAKTGDPSKDDTTKPPSSGSLAG